MGRKKPARNYLAIRRKQILLKNVTTYLEISIDCTYSNHVQPKIGLAFPNPGNGITLLGTILLPPALYKQKPELLR